jgi:hypothetical protein
MEHDYVYQPCFLLFFIFAICPSVIILSTINNYLKTRNLSNFIDLFNLLFEPEEIAIENKQDNIPIIDNIFPKYEEKYLNDIKNLNKEWIFTSDELREIDELTVKYYENEIEQNNNKIIKFKNTITELENLIETETEENYLENEEYSNDEEVNDEEVNDEENNDEEDNDEEDNDEEEDDNISYVSSSSEENNYEIVDYNSLQIINNKRRQTIENLKVELQQLELFSDENYLTQLKNDLRQKATNIIIQRHLDRLKNCFIIEKTPLGNVIMKYDIDKKSFKYYSDFNIPYRYLEVVSRKFVKTFYCRPIYIDMDEELKLFEEKWVKEEEEKKKQDEMKTINENKDDKKKSVFAKFKNNNTTIGNKIDISKIKANFNNITREQNKEKEKILLKEKSNRYTFEGKIANFSILQKIDRKIFNKKLGLTFADFKKLKNN